MTHRAKFNAVDQKVFHRKCLITAYTSLEYLFQAIYTLFVVFIIKPSSEYETSYSYLCEKEPSSKPMNCCGERYFSMNGKQRPGLYFAHAQDDLNAHFAHVRRHFFA